MKKSILKIETILPKNKNQMVFLFLSGFFKSSSHQPLNQETSTNLLSRTWSQSRWRLSSQLKRASAARARANSSLTVGFRAGLQVLVSFFRCFQKINDRFGTNMYIQIIFISICFRFELACLACQQIFNAFLQTDRERLQSQIPSFKTKRRRGGVASSRKKKNESRI